jgi:mono/diheme cytochrome c family protein
MKRRNGRRLLVAGAGLAAVGALAGLATDAADAGAPPAGDRDGQALYAKNCSSCHGETGRGDGPSGLFLRRKPADLRSADVRKMSDDELFDRITAGKPPMPGFGRRLSDEARRTLVRYVRGLSGSGP